MTYSVNMVAFTTNPLQNNYMKYLISRSTVQTH